MFIFTFFFFFLLFNFSLYSLSPQSCLSSNMFVKRAGLNPELKAVLPIKEDELSLNISLGGTKLSMSFVNHKGEVLSLSKETFYQEHPQEGPLKRRRLFIQELHREITSFIDENDHIMKNKSLSTIGFSWPGVIYNEKGVDYIRRGDAPGFREFIAFPEKVRARELLPSSLGLLDRVVFQNDGQAAALGVLNEAQSCRNFALMGIGTGLGGGIVIDGQLHRQQENALLYDGTFIVPSSSSSVVFHEENFIENLLAFSSTMKIGGRYFAHEFLTRVFYECREDIENIIAYLNIDQFQNEIVDFQDFKTSIQKVLNRDEILIHKKYERIILQIATIKYHAKDPLALSFYHYVTDIIAQTLSITIRAHGLSSRIEGVVLNGSFGRFFALPLDQKSEDMFIQDISRKLNMYLLEKPSCDQEIQEKRSIAEFERHSHISIELKKIIESIRLLSPENYEKNKVKLELLYQDILNPQHCFDTYVFRRGESLVAREMRLLDKFIQMKEKIILGEGYCFYTIRELLTDRDIIPNVFKVGSNLIVLNERRFNRILDKKPADTYSGENYQLAQNIVQKHSECWLCQEQQNIVQKKELSHNEPSSVWGVHMILNSYPLLNEEDNLEYVLFPSNDEHVKYLVGNKEDDNFLKGLIQFSKEKKGLVTYSNQSATYFDHAHAFYFKNLPHNWETSSRYQYFQIRVNINKEEEVHILNDIVRQLEGLGSYTFALAMDGQYAYLSITKIDSPEISIPFLNKNFGALELLKVWIIEDYKVFNSLYRLNVDTQMRMFDIIYKFIFHQDTLWMNCLGKTDYNTLKKVVNPQFISLLPLQPYADLKTLLEDLAALWIYRIETQISSIVSQKFPNNPILLVYDAQRKEYEHQFLHPSEGLPSLKSVCLNGFRNLLEFMPTRAFRAKSTPHFLQPYKRDENSLTGYSRTRARTIDYNACTFKCMDKASHFHPNGSRFVISVEGINWRFTYNQSPMIRSGQYLVIPYTSYPQHFSQTFNETGSEKLCYSFLKMLPIWEESYPDGLISFSSIHGASVNHWHLQAAPHLPDMWKPFFSTDLFQYAFPFDKLDEMSSVIYKLLKYLDNQPQLTPYCIVSYHSKVYVIITQPDSHCAALAHIGKLAGYLEYSHVFIIESDKVVENFKDKTPEEIDDCLDEALTSVMMNEEEFSVFESKYPEEIQEVQNYHNPDYRSLGILHFPPTLASPSLIGSFFRIGKSA